MMSLHFEISYRVRDGITTMGQLQQYASESINPLISRMHMAAGGRSIGSRYMEYVGALVDDGGDFLQSIPEHMSTNYTAAITPGATLASLQDRIYRHMDPNSARRYIESCMILASTNPTKYKFQDQNYTCLRARLQGEKDSDVISQDSQIHSELYSESGPTSEEIDDVLASTISEYAAIKTIWNSESLGAYRLSLPGLALAISNIQAITNEEIDIESWITDPFRETSGRTFASFRRVFED